MKFYISYLLVFFICSATLLSCVEEQDFNQFDDLSVTPTVEASLLYVEAPESAINDSEGADVISRNFNFDTFTSENFASRVLDGTLTYVIQNTTSKALSITIELLNAEEKVINREILSVEPEMPESITTIFYGDATRPIGIIRQTLSIRVTVTNTNGDTTSISDLPDPKIILKSSGKFRLNLK